MIKFRLPLLLILLTVPTALLAHEVYLKDGSVLKTNYIYRDNSQLTYRQFGGDVSIPLSDVEKIVFTKSGISQVAGAADADITDSDNDLQVVLESKLVPKNQIEKANLAVVSITTSAGSGSGFFINADGLIVTNRHVVRGSDVNNQKVEQEVGKATSQLNEWQQNLEREKSQLDHYHNRLKQEWVTYRKTIRENEGRVNENSRVAAEKSLNEKAGFLKKMQRDYDKRKNEYLDKKREIDQQVNDFQQKKKKLSYQTRFSITLADGQSLSATLFRVSKRLDLALLKINGYRTPYLEVADVDVIALGQPVYAIGSPLNLQNSVTSGVISNFRGEYIQTNSEIYPGNSGGPLVTEEGHVVGVNSMKLITEKFEGIGFAINITEVLSEFSDFFQR